MTRFQNLSTRPSCALRTGAFVAVLLLGLGLWAAPASAQTTGSISGTVTDATTGAPLSGVRVILYNASNAYVGYATTNTSGVYTRTNLAAGTYYLGTTNSLGYLNELYDNIPCSGTCSSYTSGTGVTVTAGVTTPGIDFALTKGGTITGIVTAEGTGTPLANIYVELYDSAGKWLSSYRTTTSGVYTHTALPAGTYYLLTSNSVGYLDELYDNIPCADCYPVPIASATGVAVAAEATVSGIDFALILGGTITGTVTDAASGLPLAGVYIYVATESFNTSGYASTDAAGAYSVIGLPTGVYSVFTSNGIGYFDEAYDNIPCPGSSCWSSLPAPSVAVTAGATTPGINFGLVLGGIIAGTVTDGATTTPLANQPVIVHDPAGEEVAWAVTNASGQYTAKGLTTGTYYVRTATTQNYLDEIYADIPCPACWVTSGASITVPSSATAVPVTTSATTPGIDFALAAGGTISGIVTDASTGLPISGAQLEASDGVSRRFAYTDASGAYAIVGLFTGTYRVRTYSVPSGPSATGYVLEVYNDLQCPNVECEGVSGTGVPVTAGSPTTGINFALSAGGTITGTIRAAGAGTALSSVVRIYRAGQEDQVAYGYTYSGDAYTVTGLPTGSYFVVAEGGDGYVGELYNDLPCPHGRCDVSAGTPVSVTAGATTGGIDFALAQGGSISGTVTDAATGLPVATEIEIAVLSTDGTILDTDNDMVGPGTYVFDGLPTGSYYVRIYFAGQYVPEIYDNVPGPVGAGIEGATPVTVTAPVATTGINFQLDRGGAISGTVAAAGTGARLWDTLVYAFLPDGQTVATATETDETSYTLTGLPPGTYYVRTYNASGYQDEVYSNVGLPLNAVADGQLVTVTGTTTTTGIDFALDVLPLAPNDSCAGALEITETPFAHLVSTRSATGAVDDALPSCAPISPVASRSVFYRFTPPADGTATIRTTGSTYSTVVSVLTGSCGGFTEVPNACLLGDWPRYYLTPPTPAGELSVEMTGGVTYTIQVAAADLDGGTLSFTLDFERAGAPPRSDFTGDGTSDLLWRGTGGDLWLWGIQGATHATDAYVGIVSDPNWEIRGQGDLDGDGMADLLWRHKLDGTVYYWKMDGPTPAAQIYVSTVDVSYDIAGTGDFDGDGKADILWRNPAIGDLWLWRMNGAEMLGQSYVDTVDLSYALKGLGDLNGDTKTDVVWQGAAGDLWAWLMNGAAKEAQPYVGTVADASYQLQQVADFDADRRADLLWWNAVAGDVWIWRMNGAEVLSEHYVGLVSDTNYRIQAAGDYNGDGKADILWRNIVAGDLWVWLMDGPVKASEAYLGLVADQGYQVVR